jgi:hypothetical protein
MLGHHRPERRALAGVQRGHRLVQQPQRSGTGRQPGQGQAATLAGRQAADFEVQQARQVEAPGRRASPVLAPAGPQGLEAQLLPGRAAGLETVLVAQQVQLFGPCGLGLDRPGLVLEADGPLRRPQQASDGAQQAGLAGPVSADQRRRFTRAQDQIQARKQPAFAPGDRQIPYENNSQHAKTPRMTWTFDGGGAKKRAVVPLQSFWVVRGAEAEPVCPFRSARDPGRGFRATVDREGISIWRLWTA